MNERQEKILECIIDDHVETALPVGSDYLVEKYGLDVSCATVRNECQILEKEGYLTHPHTSAGRIPTEAGYQHYVNLKLKIKSEKFRKHSLWLKKDALILEKSYNQAKKLEVRDQLKSIAKSLASLAQGAVLIGFDRRDTYYTGLSYLFGQPEFQNHELVYNVSAIADHLDEVIEKVYNYFPDEVTVKIGSRNPFGVDCSFVGLRLRVGRADRLFGLLGPMRMDYLANMGRVEYVKQLLGN